MDKQEIVSKVIETVADVQTVGGRPSAGIDASTCPIGGVEGFDSLNGVEATVMLSGAFGVDLPDDYNPFVSNDGRRALTISEIADSLSAYLKPEVVSR